MANAGRQARMEEWRILYEKFDFIYTMDRSNFPITEVWYWHQYNPLPELNYTREMYWTPTLFRLFYLRWFASKSWDGSNANPLFFKAGRMASDWLRHYQEKYPGEEIEAKYPEYVRDPGSDPLYIRVLLATYQQGGVSVPCPSDDCVYNLTECNGSCENYKERVE